MSEEQSFIDCAILTDIDDTKKVLRMATVGKEVFLDICQVTADNNQEYHLKRVAQIVVSWHEFVNLLYAMQEVSQ